MPRLLLFFTVLLLAGGGPPTPAAGAHTPPTESRESGSVAPGWESFEGLGGARPPLRGSPGTVEASTPLPAQVHDRPSRPAITLRGRAASSPAEPVDLDWELLPGPGGSVRRLFAPESGALFARVESGLSRSDDAGTTWSPVRIPWPRGPVGWLLVDPVDHRRIFGDGPDGIYRTEDDGVTAARILEIGDGERLNAFASSPADRALLYADLGVLPTPTLHWLLRSRDGGASWEEVQRQGSRSAMYGYVVPLLEPHPTDPARLFRAQGPAHGGTSHHVLEVSGDQGATWSPVLDDNLFYPRRLVGSRGASPERFYVAGNLDRRTGGSSVYRSVDGGLTWERALEHRGGGAYGSPGPFVEIGGLIRDPSAPDRVYVALNRFEQPTWEPTWVGSVVRSSADGGATWTDLGRSDFGEINDLALGVDGRNLYAAGPNGIWRLRLR